MKDNLDIADLKEKQLKLYELNKEKWNDMEPKYAKDHILYMVEEIGECISIIIFSNCHYNNSNYYYFRFIF